MKRRNVLIVCSTLIATGLVALLVVAGETPGELPTPTPVPAAPESVPPDPAPATPTGGPQSGNPPPSCPSTSGCGCIQRSACAQEIEAIDTGDPACDTGNGILACPFGQTVHVVRCQCEGSPGGGNCSIDSTHLACR